MNIGDKIGSFTITSRLGAGGMGEVFLAEQANIDTKVAIKVLRSEISSDKEHVSRFFNEARAVGRIKHAGTVKIFEGGFHSAGNAYLIMEFLEGETLTSRIKRAGRLGVATACDLGRQIASILSATHAVGITHRDLKPDNIFIVADAELDSGERVKILDFGIAKLTGTMASGPRTVGTMGTPSYMAPEQWGDSANVDWRADAYSLGCVLFEMTTSRPPFLGASFADLCAKHLTTTPPTPGSLGIRLPPALESIIMRLLSKDPKDRATTLAELGRELDAIGKTAPAASAETIPPPIAAGTPSAELAATVPPTLHTETPTPPPTFKPHEPPPPSNPEIRPPLSAQIKSPVVSSPEITPPVVSSPEITPPVVSSPEITPPHPEVASAQSTTMRGASGEVSKRGNGRGGLVAIGALAVVAGGFGIAVKVRGGSNDKPVEPPTPPPSIDAAERVAMVDAGGATVDAWAPRNITNEMTLLNSFVTKSGVTMLSHQVTYNELKLYLDAVHPSSLADEKPLLEPAKHGPDDAVGGMSHDRARRFCNKLGARLPTADEWKKVVEKNEIQWGIKGDRGVGPLREWTADVDQGLATVLGDYSEMGVQKLLKSTREPLQIMTEANAGRSDPKQIASVHIGFRCVK